MWTRPALRAQSGAARRPRAVVSDSARRDRARELVRGRLRGAVERHRGRAVRRASCRRRRDRPAAFFIGRHEPRKGLATLLDAWQGLERDAVLWVGGYRTADRRAARRARVRTSSGSGAITDAERDAAAARRDGLLRAVARRRVVRRGAARGHGRGDPGRRIGHRGLRQRGRAPTSDALLVPPGDARRARGGRCGRCSTSRRLRERLVASGHERADEFSMARLAGRYLELYERVLVPAR